MAYRPVVTALCAMEGYGYIVIGAELRATVGVTRINPSELGRAIEPSILKMLDNSLTDESSTGPTCHFTTSRFPRWDGGAAR